MESQTNDVTVVDVKMPFASMVVFMVKLVAFEIATLKYDPFD
jgi:hypothetical protein